jgi:3-hydroxyisobutyrate dehydrogenase
VNEPATAAVDAAAPQRRVAIVGIGNMGGAIAANLLGQGWQVDVRDLDAAKERALVALGARSHATPAQAVRQAGLLIVCVVDGRQTEEVLFGSDGAAAAMRPGQAVMLCPTLAPQDVEALAARLAALGLAALDAPMSGGPARARDASMSLMLACADEVFECHRDLIAALSRQVFRISRRPGDGARTKLVNNLLAGINLVGAAEALALAVRLGLDPAATLAVIEQSSGQSWIGSDRMHRALAGDYAPRAHMSLLEKDTRLAMEAAAAVDFCGPLGAQAAAVFAQASRAGLAAQDDAALFQMLTSRLPTMAP